MPSRAQNPDTDAGDRSWLADARLWDNSETLSVESPAERRREFKISLASEAGELLELFLWRKKPTREQLKEELADIAIYLLMTIDYSGFDFEEIIKEKIEKNRKKYPAVLPAKTKKNTCNI